MSKIGLYGGTFNPIHFGHLNLAFELMENSKLDEVWWMPTSCSPFRQDDDFTAEQRLKMVELALEGIPQFKVCTLEIHRPPPAYTIDTVREILSLYPNDEFYLLLGEDALVRFMDWKEPLELIRLIPFLIGHRSGNALPKFPDEIEKIISESLVETPLIDISATRIRKRLKNRRYCGHLLPWKVLDFIYVNQLYFTA